MNAPAAAHELLPQVALRPIPEAFMQALQARFGALSEQSLQEQRRIEANDSMPFEIYRQQYIAPQRLGLSRGAIAPSLGAP